MIYFLDNSLQLQKIVTSKNINSAIHEHELNGLIRGDIELDLSYANKFLILGIDHVGYYYGDEFYLHKIQRVEYDHVNETATVVLRHIFFEDMIFGKLIRDVRPQNQDALAVSRQTIDANTRWQTIMTDITGRLSTNFYWQVPYEVIEFMTENYRIEYLPKILFDGKKINGFQLHLANKIGEDKNIRIPYGSRVLDLKYEEDYSEIITKLVVHGKGEEVGDGYGRRINISDVNFSRNGVKSPVGSLYLEDESITNTYGNDGQTPREGREVFEDIEDANELAEAGYQHYLQVSRPQMLFTADVADIGDVGIGDSVMIIRREYDVYFKARIHKLSVDLLYPEDAQVELGDYKHFKESKITRKSREKNNRVQKQLSDRITRLKLEANERFDNEVQQWKNDFEQALIDAEAAVEAMRVTMTEEFEAAQKEFEEEFNQSVADAKQHADDAADAKAAQVQGNLDSFSDEHSRLLSEVQSDVIGVSDSLTGISSSLSDIEGTLANTRTELENRIDATEEALGKVGEDLGNAKTDLQNQLDEARAELDGLEIGGRNYILNSENGIWLWSNNSTAQPYSNEEFEDYHLYKTLEPSTGISSFTNNYVTHPIGTKHMDSVEVLSSVDVYAAMNMRDLGNKRFFVPADTWTRIYTERTMTSDRERVLGIRTDRPVPDGLKYRKYMNHLGHIPMDWTPAPEDTEQKITSINQTITNIEGELSTKVEQTEVDALKGTVTRQGTLLTQTADEVSSKAEKSVVDTLTGRVTNTESSVTQNANEIAKKLTKSDYDEDKKATDAKITQWSNTASETAEGLTRVIGRVSETEKGVDTAQTRIEAEAGRIDGVLSRTSKVEGQVRDAELAIEANADGLALRATKTEVENAIDGIEVGGRNYMLNSSDEKYSGSREHMYYGRIDDALENIGEDGLITVSFDVKASTGDYLMAYNDNRRGQWYFAPTTTGTFRGIGTEWVRLSFQARVMFDEDREISETILEFFGAYDTGNTFSIKNVKIEKGNKSTDWTPAPEDIDAKITKVSSDLEVEAGRIEGLVTDISKDYVKQSSVKVTPDSVTIGSTVVNGTTIGSVLSVSPTGIDAVADAMRLSGDLYVDGDITTLAVNAIEGNFSRLFASSLTTNVIKSNHIQTDTALAEKLFATNANIDELVTRTHFSNSIKTLSIDAVHADLRSVNSEIMTTNILKSEWIDVDNAIVNRIISRQFFTDNATIKAANIIDLTATDIKGGVLSSLNNSMKFDLITNHLEFNRNATIDFYSKNNMFRMIYPSSIKDNRNVIAGFGTTEARNGSNLAYFGGGHYDIDGTIKANDTGFAGLRVGGGSNDSRLTGTNVEVGSGNASNDMYFRFDFEGSGSSRYARFRPPTSADNYVIGGSSTPFHSIYSWRINRLRFTNLSGNTEIRYDNGGTNGAGFRFTETDVYFVRGGLFSIKQAVDRADSAYDSINSSNGLRNQIRRLASRVSALER